MLWNPGSSLMQGSSGKGHSSSRVGNAFLGVLLIIVAVIVGSAVYTKSRSQAKRASSLRAPSLEKSLAQPAESSSVAPVDNVSAAPAESSGCTPAVEGACPQEEPSQAAAVYEKLKRCLQRLLSRKIGPCSDLEMPTQHNRASSCSCHQGAQVLSFHSAFHQQRPSNEDASSQSPSDHASDNASPVFLISGSGLQYNVSTHYGQTRVSFC